MFNDKRIARLLPLIAAVSLSACSSMPETLVSPPEVELVSVEVDSMSINSQTFLLGFVVTNPNHFSLPVETISYRVRLGEHHFASGSTQSQFRVPARGNGTFVISVELDILNTTTQVASLLRTGIQRNVGYELSGSFGIDLPYVKPVKFENTGTISVAANF